MNKTIDMEALINPIRKQFDLGEGEVVIYQPNEDIINKIIEMQEFYYKENKVSIPDRVIILELIKEITNIDFNMENELYLHEILDNPPLWLKLVKEEIKEIMIDINKLKHQEARNNIKELEMYVEQYNSDLEMPNNVKQFFKDKKEDIKNLGDSEFLSAVKELNLIEEDVEETEEEKIKKEILQLQEKLTQAKTNK